MLKVQSLLHFNYSIYIAIYKILSILYKNLGIEDETKMENFTQNIAPLLDIFFAGISTFLAVFLIYAGIQKRILYNIIIGLALFFFTFDFAVTFLELNTDISVPFNFYLLAILALYIYSYSVIYRRKSIVFKVTVALQIIVFLSFLAIGKVSENTEKLIIISSSVISIYMLILTLKNLKKYQAKIKDFYSNIKQKGLKGVFLITYLFLLFNCIWLIDDTLSFFFTENEILSFLPVLSYLFSYASVVILGFYALKKQYFITEIKEATTEITILEEQKTTETNNQTFDEELFERITHYITSEKAYLNPNLSLNDLSLQLNSKNKIVSQTINHFAKTTFYNFVNNYRVNHFKTLISENKNAEMSIDGLIEICGFKSKSTFYNHFKRVEGCTPTQFIKNHK